MASLSEIMLSAEQLIKYKIDFWGGGAGGGKKTKKKKQTTTTKDDMIND